MVYPHRRGLAAKQDDQPRPAAPRHPNWGHPDHDACGTGFIARLGAAPSYDIVQFALTALERLTHRGGVDADGASGDGAGLLTSLPKPFFRARAAEQGIELPELFGVGFAFLPASDSKTAQAAIEAAADIERLRLLGWRRVPVNTDSLGRRALETMPEIWQFFVESFHPSRETARLEWRRIAPASAKLHLLALLADGCLQRSSDAMAIPPVL
jgi:glutamate synthase domain-containing protein 1